MLVYDYSSQVLEVKTKRKCLLPPLTTFSNTLGSWESLNARCSDTRGLNEARDDINIDGRPIVCANQAPQ